MVLNPFQEIEIAPAWATVNSVSIIWSRQRPGVTENVKETTREVKDVDDTMY